MSRSGRIHVRADAKPEECRVLAAELIRWYRAEFDRLRLVWVDIEDLDELEDDRVCAHQSSHACGQ